MRSNFVSRAYVSQAENPSLLWVNIQVSSRQFPLSSMELLSASGRFQYRLHIILLLLGGIHCPPVATAEASRTRSLPSSALDTLSAHTVGILRTASIWGAGIRPGKPAPPLRPQTQEGHALLPLISPCSPHSAL